MAQIQRDITDVIKKLADINKGLPPIRKGVKEQTQNFSDILKNFSDVNAYIKPENDQKGVLSTAIPYLYSLYGDIAVNPSTVSTSEFQKMAYGDPTIYSCLKYTSLLVINRIADYEHPNEDIKHIVNYSLNNLVLGKRRLFEAMLTALWSGFFVGEKVFGLLGNKIIIENVVPLPPVSIIFRIDTNGFVKDDGIVQYFYNNMITGYANLLSFTGGSNGQNVPNPMAKKGDLDYPLRTPWAQPVGSVLLPKDKMIHFTLQGVDGLMNPYGRSSLRSIYDKYVQYQALLQITMIGANYKSSPVPIFYVDPTVPLINQTTNQPIDLARDIADSITRLKGNGFLVINGKKGAMVDHAVIDNTADLQQLTQLLTFYNNEKREGLLTPSSLLGNMDGGSYALSLTQSSAHSKYIDSITEELCDCLITQFVKPIINANYKSEKNLGYFKINEDTLTDKERLSKILEVAVRTNIVNPGEIKDLNLAREWMGYPETDKPFSFTDMDDNGKYDTTNRNVNIMKTRQETNQPYSRNKL